LKGGEEIGDRTFFGLAMGKESRRVRGRRFCTEKPDRKNWPVTTANK